MALFFARQPPKVIWANRSRARCIWVNRQFAFQDEVVATISAHTAQVVLPGSYFGAADWTNPLLRKRLVITNGAHVWSYSQGVAALDLGTGRQGDLYVDVHAGAYVLGHHGSRNSGVGGTAIKVRQNQCWINNAGGIYGGGGGGGRGGNGGAGVWYSGRTVSEGPILDGHNNANTTYYWAQRGQTSAATMGPYALSLYWGGSLVYNAGSSYSTSVNVGGVTYHRGNYYTMANTGSSPSDEIYTAWYYISRSYIVYDVPSYTSGGAGGNGGQGAGYSSSLIAMTEGGFGGSAGGTNAGTGGTGGAGGGWGAWGSTGNTGVGGNAGSGVAGATGGAPGYYIDGYANLNGFTNTGSALGRQQ